MNKAVYAGSFDPMTFGHLDIIKRGASLFEELYIAVATNTSKNAMLSSEEKFNAIKQTIKDEQLDNVVVKKFEDGLIVDFAKELGANTLIRGLRSVKDFEYETEIDSLNKTQNPDIETIYLMASVSTRPISSTLVREIAHFDGQLEELVPKAVIDVLKNK